MRAAWMLALLMVDVAAAAPADQRAATASPLHGNLKPGPYAVGLTRLTVRDRQRPTGPRVVDGKPVPLDTRARLIAVDVWYPAVPDGQAAPMTVTDYLGAHPPADAVVPAPPAAVQSRAENLRRYLASLGTISDESFTRLLAQPFLAVRDAAPAAGSFPLLVGHLRPLATTITNEHLASHGYVVAMVSAIEPPGIEDGGRGLELAVRDMEVAIAELRTRPYVDPVALGAFGFSGNGFSQLLLAMRHPDVAAVCDLESAIFDDRVMWPLSGGWGYDVAALRVPFLHMYGVPLSARENRRADFEAMRYSARYHYLVDAPGLAHADFATEGMLASLTPGLRGDKAVRLQQAFETTNRYLRAFFDAHVKRDASARAFLEGSPDDHGVPAGLVTWRVLPAIAPAPALDDIVTLARDRGRDAALQAFREGRVRDPGARLYEERSLNMLGYRLFRNGDAAAGAAILETAVALFPDSPNAYDSLSEVLEAAGRKDEARAVVLRGLEAAARPAVSASDRATFTRLLNERLTRLGSS